MAVFNNSYLIMRHGQSEANVAGLIVSDPAIGCQRFGLTENGRLQVSNSAQGHSETAISQIICSDFLRTRQTAQLAAEVLGRPSPQLEVGLRERFFGCWEGLSDEHYQGVWQHDQTAEMSSKESVTADNVELVEQVLQRGLKVLEKLEQQYLDQVILLVSHGDMLQILRTAFVGKPAWQHRSLPHHQTGEIKWLAAQGDKRPSL